MTVLFCKHSNHLYFYVCGTHACLDYVIACHETGHVAFFLNMDASSTRPCLNYVGVNCMNSIFPYKSILG